MNKAIEAALEETLDIGEDKLTQIADAVDKMVTLDAKIASHEAHTKEMKAERRKLSEDIIPSLLDGAGVTGIVTHDGRSVKLTNFYNAECKTAEQFAWMEANGHGDIIKDTITLTSKDLDPQKRAEIVDRAKEFGCAVEEKAAIHHGTLKAFVKEQIEDGGDIDMALLKVFVGRQTKVSKVND